MFEGLGPIHPEDRRITDLAEAITEGWATDGEIARDILAWMQRNIAYGNLNLFKHPYPKTDLEVLDDGEGLCQDLVALYLSLAQAAGLEVCYADYSHIGAGVHLDEGWVLVDPTPFYYPNYGIDAPFKQKSVERLARDFRDWMGYLVEDARYVGLPLGYLLGNGSYYERVAYREKDSIGLVFSAFMVEHGERGGIDCDASRMTQVFKQYAVPTANPDYELAYRTYPLELRLKYDLGERGSRAQFLRYDERTGKHIPVHECPDLTNLPAKVKGRFSHILSHVPIVQDLTNRVLQEMRRVHTVRMDRTEIHSRADLVDLLTSER